MHTNLKVLASFHVRMAELLKNEINVAMALERGT
jgi:hypothetical protein